MGVTRVQVMLAGLKGGEAIVTYDPRAATTDALIAAVNNAIGPFGGIEYKASIKEPPRP